MAIHGDIANMVFIHGIMAVCRTTINASDPETKVSIHAFNVSQHSAHQAASIPSNAVWIEPPIIKRLTRITKQFYRFVLYWDSSNKTDRQLKHVMMRPNFIEDNLMNRTILWNNRKSFSYVSVKAIEEKMNKTTQKNRIRAKTNTANSQALLCFYATFVNLFLDRNGFCRKNLAIDGRFEFESTSERYLHTNYQSQSIFFLFSIPDKRYFCYLLYSPISLKFH